MSTAPTSLKPLYFAFAILAALAQFKAPPAEAATLRLIQQWEHENFSSNLRTIRTGARFDDSVLIGSGTERIPIDQFNVINLMGGVGQSSEVAVFTDPPDLLSEVNIFAEYLNGSFVGLFNVPGAGAGVTELVDEVSLFDSGNRVLVNGPRLLYTTFGNYDLKSSDFTNLSAVPAPAALPLFATGLSVLGWFGWRRRRKTPVV